MHAMSQLMSACPQNRLRLPPPLLQPPRLSQCQWVPVVILTRAPVTMHAACQPRRTASRRFRAACTWAIRATAARQHRAPARVAPMAPVTTARRRRNVPNSTTIPIFSASTRSARRCPTQCAAARAVCQTARRVSWPRRRSTAWRITVECTAATGLHAPVSRAREPVAATRRVRTG